jgi:hypothetical protein
MKRYRVWEATRKVFLWPENWLEPELRNDQSPFFTDVMSELLQGDITEERAATAMIDYLSKLEEVAQPEPCGMHYVENNAGTSDDVLHVVARTPGSKRAYFYRRREGIIWTPWEPIKLDIEDNPVLPYVWNGRLFLFWLRIIQQTSVDPNSLPTTSETTGTVADLSLAALKSDARSDALKASTVGGAAVLCWSEYYDGKWQPQKTSDPNRPSFLFQKRPSTSYDRSELSLMAHPEGNGLRIKGGIMVDTFGLRESEPSFLFYNSYTAPVRGEDAVSGSIPPLKALRLLVDDHNKEGIHKLWALYWPAMAGWAILDSPLPFAVTQTIGWPDASNWPFFFADSRRAYLVTSNDPGVTVQNFTGFGMMTAQFSPRPAFFPSPRLQDGSGQTGATDPRDATFGLRSPLSASDDWSVQPGMQTLLTSPVAQPPHADHATDLTYTEGNVQGGQS